MNLTKKFILILLLSTWTTLVYAAQDIAARKQQVLSCAACHGSDGNSRTAIFPSLAGQHPAYLIKQMQAFKQGSKGGRINPAMTAIMAKLTVADMQSIAAYYAQQQIKQGAAEPQLVKHGATIYRGGDFAKHLTACIACHGPTADGNALAGFPKLSGQQAQYTIQQLVNFKNGTRNNDLNHIMRDIASRMDNSDMEAVASYISGLH